MVSPQPYTYTPLQEADAIRLIVLYPSPEIDAPVHISLISVTLSDYDDEIIDSYTALSYVWGKVNDKRTILIDGHNLEITASLDSALRHLRDQKRELKVWADGICINQGDLDERSVQVMIMGKIYEFARHTIIFLGDSTPEIDNVMDILTRKEHSPVSHFESGFLRNVSHMLAVESDDSFHRRSCEPQSSAKRSPKGISDESRRFIAEHILKRPWFSRVWVLQELVLSADPWLQVGARRIRWNLFCDLVLYGINPSEFMGGMLTLSDMNDTRARLGPFWQKSLIERRKSTRVNADPGNTAANMLLRILHVRRGFGVADPRDMIYAHLGLVQDSRSPITLPQADYRLAPHQLYTEFAAYCLRYTGNLEFLPQIGERHSDGRVEDLPSWVPDWTSFRTSSAPLVPGLISWDLKGIDLLHTFHDTSNVLACVGHFLDTVKTIKEGVPPYVDLQEVYNEVVGGYRSKSEESKRPDRLSEHDLDHTDRVDFTTRMSVEDEGDKRLRQLMERMYARISDIFYTWLADPSLPYGSENSFEYFFGQKNVERKGKFLELLSGKLLNTVISFSDPELRPSGIKPDLYRKSLQDSSQESATTDPLSAGKHFDPLSFLLLEMTNPYEFKHISDWKIAVTEGSKLALVPPTTVEGDVIVDLLSNHLSPYILRRVPREEVNTELEQDILREFSQKIKTFIQRDRNGEFSFISDEMRWEPGMEFPLKPNTDSGKHSIWGSKEAGIVLLGLCFEAVMLEVSIGNFRPEAEGAEAGMSEADTSDSENFLSQSIAIEHCIFISNCCFRTEPDTLTYSDDRMPTKVFALY